jgi:hypothetical protein
MGGSFIAQIVEPLPKRVCKLKNLPLYDYPEYNKSAGGLIRLGI